MRKAVTTSSSTFPSLFTTASTPLAVSFSSSTFSAGTVSSPLCSEISSLSCAESLRSSTRSSSSESDSAMVTGLASWPDWSREDCLFGNEAGVLSSFDAVVGAFVPMISACDSVGSGVKGSGLGCGETFSIVRATAVSILDCSIETGLWASSSPCVSVEDGIVSEVSFAGTAGAPFPYRGLASIGVLARADLLVAEPFGVPFDPGRPFLGDPMMELLRLSWSRMNTLTGDFVADEKMDSKQC